MLRNRIYKAIILLDEPGGTHYATLVENELKTIETRMMLFKYTGDIIICCSAGSMTRNKGKALCLVHFGQGRRMTKEDEPAAHIGCVEGRYAFPLSNWRRFSRKFTFAKCKVGGTFQGLFDIIIPEDVEIL